MSSYSRPGGQDGRRGSRWGDRPASRSNPPPPNHDNNHQASTSSQGVSDDEALRALMAAAQEREQERSSFRDDNRKRGRDQSRQGPNHRDRDGSRNQRLPENNSYYGPRPNNDENRRQRPRRELEPRGPTEVEPEEGVANDEAKNEEDEKKPPAHKPNFGLSGTLAKDAGVGGNVYKGVVLKFQEPPEARAPNTQWRFYVFKGEEILETLHISKQSAYLCGRHKEICDIYMAHPSLSSQHAVLQYRAVPNAQGRLSCQPYIMDLESTNGTFLNGVRIDSARYYQLKKGDILKFGASQREYVLLTENTTALR